MFRATEKIELKVGSEALRFRTTVIKNILAYKTCTNTAGVAHDILPKRKLIFLLEIGLRVE